MTTLQKLTDTARAITRGNGLYEFQLSSGKVDRDGDTLNPRGWKLDEYRKNPVVQWGHRHDVPAIGRTIDIGVRDDRLMATMEFPPAGIYPLADHVRGLVEAGILTTTSVGFRAIRGTPNRERGGIDYHEQELVEWSIVNVPSNTDARLVAPETRGADLVAIAKWLGNGDEVFTLDNIAIAVAEPTIVLRDDTPRDFDAVLASTTLTTHGDRYLAWTWPAAGVPVFIAHRETPRPVGRAYPGRKSADGARQYGVLRFPAEGVSAASDRAVLDIQSGLLTALSTAADLDRTARPAHKNAYGGRDYPRVVVREVSLVAHGANPDMCILRRGQYIDAEDFLARATPDEQRAMAAEILQEHGPALIKDVVQEAVLPEVRRAYMMLSGRLD